MKKIITLFLLAFLLLVITSQGASSVELRKERSITGVQEDNIRLSLRLVGGKGAVVRQGRSIGFTIQVNEDAYVVVYNIDADGYIHLLFPYDGKLKKLEGRKIYYFPEKGSEFEWVASGDTGIEYIHAIAVKDRDRIKEEELYYLLKNERLPDDKRFRVDSDPFTAFNMIDEELVVDAEDIPPATDYTYFYINRRVEYPRYLCYRCHGEDKVGNPYSDDCPEVTIERLSYDEEPSYPYPPLYEISHVDSKDYYDTDKYSEKWFDDDKDYEDNETNVYLSIFYTNYDYPYRYYWPSYRAYIVGVAYPLWWDDFWWGFGWSVGWADYYYFYWPFYTWWTPYNYYWAYRSRYGWWRCYYCEPYYAYRPVYGTRRVIKRTLDYRRTYTTLHRNTVLAKSKIVRTKTPRLANRYERSNLKRKVYRSSDYSKSRFISQKRRLDRTTIRGRKTVYSPAVYRKSSIRTRKSKSTKRAKDARAPSVKRNPESRKRLKSDSNWRTKSYDNRSIRNATGKKRTFDKSYRLKRSNRKNPTPARREKGTKPRKKSTTSTRKSSSSRTPSVQRSIRSSKTHSPTRVKSSSSFRSVRSPSRPSTPVKSSSSRPTRARRR